MRGALVLYIAAGSLQDALAALREAQQPDTAAMFIIACREIHSEYIENLDPNNESDTLIKEKLLVLPGLNPENEDVKAVESKELIEKVQNRINDWKNKSLSAAGRLQLVQLVIGSMHVYWASVFTLPSRVLLDIEQLMRGFLWCQVDMRRGKAKVAWEDVPIRGNMVWGWRKVLQIRPIIQEFIWYRIGDGSKVSVWFNHWCLISPLSKIVLARDIHRAGFDISTMIKDLFNNGQWTWSHDWISKYPALAIIVVPNIVSNAVDELEWRDSSGTAMDFSVLSVWECIHPRGDEITWCDVVWFLNCISRHAFHLWLVIKWKLKTQDNLRQWDVWNHMKIYAGTPRVAASLNVIIDHIIPMSKKKTTRSVIAKLVFAASSFGKKGIIGCSRIRRGLLIRLSIASRSWFDLSFSHLLEDSSLSLVVYGSRLECHLRAVLFFPSLGFETYVKSKDLDLWHVIIDGDFPPIQNNPETKKDEVVPFHKQNDDLKKKLAKNNEAKMVIYNALPRKEYERIFMCQTAKEIWDTLLITHQGNNQVKANKIDLLVQQYEQFMIPEEESIDNAFAKFNTIITSLKALDEEYVFRCGDPNHLIGECSKPPKNNNQRAFIGRSWSDRDEDEEEKTMDEKYLMAKASNEEMLKKFRLEDSKPIKTPMSTKTKLTRDEEGESIDNTKYRGMIGLWYPKGSDIETIVYADSDHAGDYVDHKSTSGVCTFMGCCLTSWFLKKQTALAISTTEAEYVSAGKACQQALWMKQALVDYGVRLDDILIMYDNKWDIDLSKNPVQHSRTKHIEIRHHFLRDNVQKGNISIEKVSSEDNIADILTKPLKRKPFNYLRLGLGMMEQID
ncbi:copia protein [Tanacetum coccineum]